ncbi:hypothetical protein [Streptomyces sp. SID3343]|uniref:hypothetical protein n=1 Tax=Streptomyces sp. SID3343 TaxID=2690260 RepID=UPI0013713174|nr:hypothetical protein [Streptomyces sp. SID3343]MYW01431.1 hypothetical protein [Streptomyces sp. SID3343]
MTPTPKIARIIVALSAVVPPLLLAVPASAEPGPLTVREISAFVCAKEHRSGTFYADVMKIETLSPMSWNGKKNPYAQARQDLLGVRQLNDHTRDEVCGPQKTQYKKLIAKYVKEYDNAPGVTLQPQYKDDTKLKNLEKERIAAYSAAVRAEQARADAN